jgi:hypothetical protein
MPPRPARGGRGRLRDEHDHARYSALQRLTCLADGKCGPGGGADQKALRIFDEETCLEGFAAGRDDKCHASIGAGGTCDYDTECQSGACDSTSHQCHDAYCE